MNQRSDGPFLPESAWKACRKDAGLFSIVTAPSLSMDEHVRALFRAANTPPKFIKPQLPENGNQRRLG
jgi:hypothetical protein